MVFFPDILKIIEYFYSKSESDRDRDQGISAYFDAIADQVRDQIGSGSVLVLGSPSYHLVNKLRDRGVQVFGALEVGQAPGEPREETGSSFGNEDLSKPFSRTYDMIVCLEVFPQLGIEEAERACKDICASTKDILFSATPYQIKGRADLIIEPPGFWAALFAKQGFFCDVDYPGEIIAPWALRFRKPAATSNELLAFYEQRIWELEREVRTQKEYMVELGNELALKEIEIVRAQQQIAFKIAENEEILNSRSWRIMQKFQRLRLRIMPIDSRQERWVLSTVAWLRLWRREGTRSFFARVYDSVSWVLKVAFLRFRFGKRFPNQAAYLGAIQPHPDSSLQSHTEKIDVVVCVHNAFEDVQRCLEALVEHTSQPFSLVLIDDGSDAPTQQYLIQFSKCHEVTLIRNEQATGYTHAANQGMKATTGDFVVLLNSDTIVTPRWIDRMLTCAKSDSQIGIVGPLSNTASWQSIPEIELNGDWAANPLPQGVTTEKMGELVEKYSGCLFPNLPFLNGFCLLIRKELIHQIGYFDEHLFSRGYGEENDYCLRASQAGWKLALADQTYIYHAQSRSYSSQERKQLAELAGKTLAKKYGQRTIDRGVEVCRWSPVLEGIRARSRIMFQREELIDKGRQQFAGKRIQFIVPIEVASGGGNVVIAEARAMRAMGVEAGILNLRSHINGFKQAYPDLDVPVTYVDINEISDLTKEFDAVIATFNPSVEWMMSKEEEPRKSILGYYVQDFEPYFYPLESEDYHRALRSYALIPGLRCLTKTEWTRQELRNQTGVKSQVVGPSFDIDLFRPRPRRDPEWPNRRLRIAAMVRTSAKYRAPRETMETLRQASRYFGARIEIILFGAQEEDPDFEALPTDFAWSLAGMRTPREMANMLNEVDIFVDFSSYQAMGLTALEAMACGVAVIVPSRGGINEIARDQANSLMIDTGSEKARWEALKRLVEDHDLRRNLQRNALREVSDYYPEGPAFRMLHALFGDSK
jgi:GT2 family glycosyltransferase